MVRNLYLFQLQSTLNERKGAGRLHEGWESTNLMSLPADLIPHVSRWAKLIARLNSTVTPSKFLYNNGIILIELYNCDLSFVKGMIRQATM